MQVRGSPHHHLAAAAAVRPLASDASCGPSTTRRTWNATTTWVRVVSPRPSTPESALVWQVRQRRGADCALVYRPSCERYATRATARATGVDVTSNDQRDAT